MRENVPVCLGAVTGARPKARLRLKTCSACAYLASRGHSGRPVNVGVDDVHIASCRGVTLAACAGTSTSNPGTNTGICTVWGRSGMRETRECTWMYEYVVLLFVLTAIVGCRAECDCSV